MTTTTQRRSLGRIAGIVFIILGVLAAMQGGIFVSCHASEQRAFALESGESLRIQGHNGKITIETWQGDEVIVEVTKEARALFKGLADWLIESENVDWIRDGNELQVVSRNARWRIFGNVSTDFHILVPED